jgi:hypothetical protein
MVDRTSYQKLISHINDNTNAIDTFEKKCKANTEILRNEIIKDLVLPHYDLLHISKFEFKIKKKRTYFTLNFKFVNPSAPHDYLIYEIELHFKYPDSTNIHFHDDSLMPIGNVSYVNKISSFIIRLILEDDSIYFERRLKLQSLNSNNASN